MQPAQGAKNPGWRSIRKADSWVQADRAVNLDLTCRLLEKIGVTASDRYPLR